MTSLLAVTLLSGGCSILGKMDIGRVMTSGSDGWQHPERVIEPLDLAPGEGFQIFAPSTPESAGVESGALEGHPPEAPSLEQARH